MPPPSAGNMALDGRLLWVEIKLSDWVCNAIRGTESYPKSY
jgi:hypothetical protein